MIDLIYVVATLTFFVFMLGYVRACDRLGRGSLTDTDRDATRIEGA